MIPEDKFHAFLESVTKEIETVGATIEKPVDLSELPPDVAKMVATTFLIGIVATTFLIGIVTGATVARGSKEDLLMMDGIFRTWRLEAVASKFVQ